MEPRRIPITPIIYQGLNIRFVWHFAGNQIKQQIYYDKRARSLHTQREYLYSKGNLIKKK